MSSMLARLLPARNVYAPAAASTCCLPPIFCAPLPSQFASPFDLHLFSQSIRIREIAGDEHASCGRRDYAMPAPA
jgi:hypothetical protein